MLDSDRLYIEKEPDMKVNTKVFGEVDIEESKILCFPHGIIGFPELTEFALIHDY